MNSQNQNFLLNTLERAISGVNNNPDTIIEAGLAAVAIARDLSDKIDSCDDPGITLVEVLKDVWEKTERSKIKVIKKFRDKTGLTSLSIAKHFIDELIMMWETEE